MPQRQSNSQLLFACWFTIAPTVGNRYRRPRSLQNGCSVLHKRRIQPASTDRFCRFIKGGKLCYSRPCLWFCQLRFPPCASWVHGRKGTTLWPPWNELSSQNCAYIHGYIYFPIITGNLHCISQLPPPSVEEEPSFNTSALVILRITCGSKKWLVFVFLIAPKCSLPNAHLLISTQKRVLAVHCKPHNKHTYTWYQLSWICQRNQSSTPNDFWISTCGNNHFNDVVLFRSLSSSNSSLSVSPIWPYRGWPLGPPWFWCSSALTVRISHHQDSSIDRPKLFRGSYASSRMINDF